MARIGVKQVGMGLVAIGGIAITPAWAQSQSNIYTATIFTTASNFCPRNSVLASGQLMTIRSNTALFSLIGVAYGGDGITNFALPNLNGRAPIGQGEGPGLSLVEEGEVGGTEAVTATIANLPAHSHANPRALINRVIGDSASPSGTSLATSQPQPVYVDGPTVTATPATTFAGSSTVYVAPTGNGQPMSIQNPYLTLTYCIETNGIYPQRP